MRFDSAFLDLIKGEGFAPELFVAPGVPRIRPVLVLLSAHAGRQENQEVEAGEIEHIALATELLHAAIVVHDAALGRQGGKRRRVARRLLGAFSWLGGNQLTLRALELVRHASSSDVISEMLDTLREIAEAHEASHRWREQLPSVVELVNHAEQHTGAVFSFACRAGGRIAHADRPTVTGLGRYGFHIGVAFHLLEDLHLLSQPKDMVLRSIEERAAQHRPLYPLCLVGEQDPQIAPLWETLCHREDQQVAENLFSRLMAANGIPRTKARILQSTWSARSALRHIPPSSHRDALEGIAQALAS